MNKNQILILSFILAVLIGGVVTKVRHQPDELATELLSSLDLSIDKALVSKIDLHRMKAGERLSSVLLAKEGEIWRISNLFGARADQKKIDALFEEIQDAKGELRVKDEGLFEDFGITEQEAFFVVFRDAGGNKLLSLRLGTKVAGLDGIFIRKENSNAIYITDARILVRMGVYGDPSAALLTKDFWVNKNLITVEHTDIEWVKIEEHYGDQMVVKSHIQKQGQESEWNYAQAFPFEIDAAKVDKFLKSAVTWKARDVSEATSEDFGFKVLSWQMHIGVAGEILTITRGRFDDNKTTYALQVSGEPYVFEVSDYYIKQMDVDDSHFMADNFLSVDPKKTEKALIAVKKKQADLLAGDEPTVEERKYLENLKSLKVKRLIFDGKEKKKVKSPSKQFIEVRNEGEGESRFLDIGDMLSEIPGEYAAVIRGTQSPFILSRKSVQDLFGNLENS